MKLLEKFKFFNFIKRFKFQKEKEKLKKNQLKEKREEKREIWLKISKICIFLTIFLLPLLFLPWTTNILDFNKQTILVFLTFISLLSFLFYSIRKGKIDLNFNTFNLFLIAFLIILGASTLFSSYRYGSFWGWPLVVAGGFLTSFCLILLYFLIINLFKKNEVLELLFVLISSVFLAVLFGISQVFGKFIFPFDFTKISSFTSIGSINSLGILSASLLPLMVLLIFIVKKLVRIFLLVGGLAMLFLVFLINFWLSWLILLIGSILILVFALARRELFPVNWLFLPIFLLVFSLVFGIMKISIFNLSTIPSETLLSYKFSFDIALQSLKDSYLSFFFGSGPATFIYNYSKFKPIIFNQTDFWLERFAVSGSELLTKLTTTGILGLISFLAILIFFGWLGFRELNKEFKEDQKILWFLNLGILTSWLGLTIGMFLYPTNLVLNFVFWFLIAVFILLISSQFKTFHFYPSPICSVYFSFLFVLIFVLGMSLLVLTSQRYFAELKYSQALRAFQQGDSQKTLNLLIGAINQTERKNDLYLRDTAQTYLLRINEEIQKEAILDERVLGRIAPLTNELFEITKRATEVAPENVNNWITRGFSYRNMIGIFGNAEEWAEKCYQKALELEPANPSIPYELGLTYLAKVDLLGQQGREEEKIENFRLAEKNFKKAIDLKSDYSPAHFQSALVLARQGKVYEAINKLEIIKQDFIFDPILAYHLGLLYYNTEQFDKAKREFQRAVSLNENYSNARYFLGLLYDKEGNKQAAIDQFQHIERFNPENPDVKKILDNLRKGKSALEGLTAIQPTFFPSVREEKPSY